MISDSKTVLDRLGRVGAYTPPKSNPAPVPDDIPGREHSHEEVMEILHGVRGDRSGLL